MKPAATLRTKATAPVQEPWAVEALPESAEEAGRQRARSDTRARLLEAALALFADRGFEATTMRDLAGAVGLKAPAIYNHFTSKEEILSTAITSTLSDFVGTVFGPDDPTGPAAARLRGIVMRHVLYQLENPTLARAWDNLLASSTFARFGSLGARESAGAAMRFVLDAVTTLIRDATRAQPRRVDPRIAALAIITMCEQVIRWYRPGKRYSRQRIAKIHWDMVAGMIGLDPAQSGPDNGRQA